MSKRIRTIIATICQLILLVFFTAACDSQEKAAEVITIAGKTMGTTYHVKVARLPAVLPEERLRAMINAELEKINNQMSTYRPMSEISQFNRFSSSGWFAVSDATVRVARAAVLVCEQSGGAFDVTLGPLVNLWGFGSERRERKVPSAEEIRAAKAKIGSQFLKTRTFPPAIRKLRRGLQVDLAAIAKGFGVDRVAELLEKHGINNYLIEIGGEIRVHGKKNDGRHWSVGVETPDMKNGRMIGEVIELQDKSLATSGGYRNFFEQDGKRYSHTIDPETSRPVTHNLALVTVITDQCMIADAWATALLVLGPEKGYKLAVDRGLAALFIVREQDEFIRKTTPAFIKLTEN